MIEKQNYELGESVTIEMLRAAGFREVVFDNKVFLSYYQQLIRDIDLFVEFDITNSNELKFNEDKNVSVIDDEDGQYFMPFYNNVDNEYVRRTIVRYNEVMHSLVNKGILKIKEKTKGFQKVK